MSREEIKYYIRTTSKLRDGRWFRPFEIARFEPDRKKITSVLREMTEIGELRAEIHSGWWHYRIVAPEDATNPVSTTADKISLLFNIIDGLSTRIEKMDAKLSSVDSRILRLEEMQSNDG